jgi:hypothetical protein
LSEATKHVRADFHHRSWALTHVLFFVLNLFFLKVGHLERTLRGFYFDCVFGSKNVFCGECWVLLVAS